MKLSDFTLSSTTQYNTSIVSLTSLEFVLMTHKKSNSLASHLLQQYLYYAPVQEKAATKITEKSSCILELDFWSALGGRGGKTPKQLTFTHTHSTKVYSPEQSSQENSQTVPDTRFILFRNHTGALVVTAWSHKTSNDRQPYLFYKMGNKQEHYLTRYITGTHWSCPCSNLKITCGRAGQKCNRFCILTWGLVHGFFSLL